MALCLGENCSTVAYSYGDFKHSATVLAALIVGEIVIRTLLLLVGGVKGNVKKPRGGYTNTPKADAVSVLVVSAVALAYFSRMGTMACLNSELGGTLQSRIYSTDPVAFDLLRVSNTHVSPAMPRLILTPRVLSLSLSLSYLLSLPRSRQ